MGSFITSFIVALAIVSRSVAQIPLGPLGPLGPPKRGDTRITVFDGAEFAGTLATFDVAKKGCTSVPTILNDKITSISFYAAAHRFSEPNCVLAYSNFGCSGSRYIVSDAVPCLGNLADPNCNYDNVISSFKSCERGDKLYAGM